MFSVIIPTYNKPKLLDLCLSSALEHQKYNTNEYIIIVDGNPDMYIDVINKYDNTHNIKFIKFDTNYGLPTATNIGVYNSIKDYVLIVNDDNVFSEDWDINYDEYISKIYKNGGISCIDSVIFTPNQIENRLSIHNGFIIQNFGTDESNFNKNEFDKFVSEYNKKPSYTTNGSTLPILCTKTAYLKVGGWNNMYPTNGLVADWDFFLKCSLNNYKFYRLNISPLYHFCESTVNGDMRRIGDIKAHDVSKKIWGTNIKHSHTNNIKSL